MKRTFAIGALAVFLGLTGAAEPVLAEERTKQQEFEDCMSGWPSKDRFNSTYQEACCKEIGGTWVDQENEDGVVTGGWCDTAGGPVGFSDPDGTTGTYEQAESGGMTTNTGASTTTGTYEQADGGWSSDGGSSTTTYEDRASERSYERAPAEDDPDTAYVPRRATYDE